MQTKKGSLLEICLNTCSGFVVAWTLTQWMFPNIYHVELSISQSWTITFIYTVMSIIRSYMWRRVFNYFIIKKVKKNEQQ